MYFGRCLPWFIIDKTPWFNRYKIQPTKIPTNQEQWECFKTVLKQHFLVEALPIWLFHPVCAKLGITYDVPFPNWKIQAIQIAIFSFVKIFGILYSIVYFIKVGFIKIFIKFIINMLLHLV